MTIITQDGRRLVISKKDFVRFSAWHSAIGCDKVEVQIGNIFKGDKAEITVTLAEYPFNSIVADQQAEKLQNALERGDLFFTLDGFKALAPNDDLMSTIIAADQILKPNCELGYAIGLGMINGKSNSSIRMNPDQFGSYKVALDNLKAKYGITEITAPTSRKAIVA